MYILTEYFNNQSRPCLSKLKIAIVRMQHMHAETRRRRFFGIISLVAFELKRHLTVSENTLVLDCFPKRHILSTKAEI